MEKELRKAICGILEKLKIEELERMYKLAVYIYLHKKEKD